MSAGRGCPCTTVLTVGCVHWAAQVLSDMVVKNESRVAHTHVITGYGKMRALTVNVALRYQVPFSSGPGPALDPGLTGSCCRLCLLWSAHGMA